MAIKINKILVVISDRMQYDALINAYGDTNSIEILCDNPEFYNVLIEKKINFSTVEDLNIKKEWQSITFWACERALFTDEVVKDMNVLDRIDLKNAYYPWFSHYLSAITRAFSMVEFIYNKYKPSEVVIFDNIYSADFPKWNTNYLLNVFLDRMAQKRAIRKRCISLICKRTSKQRNSLKDVCRIIFGKIYGLISSLFIGQFDFLVYCESKHILPVIKEMKKRGKKILYYDLSLRIKNLRLCKNTHIQYVIPESFSLWYNFKVRKYNKIYKDELSEFLKNLEKHRWFTYKGNDISNIVCSEIRKACNLYINRLSSSSIIYRNIIKKSKIKKLILSEDVTVANAYMAAFFKSKKCKVFCVSHGYPLLYPHIPNFSLAEIKKRFALSETLVQSDFEKRLYEKKGWDKEHIHLTGMPRYDKIVELKANRYKNRKQNKKMKLLYCASGMFVDNRLLSAYPGGHYNGTSYHAKECFRKLVQATEGLNIELILKPHYSTDEFAWKKYVEQYRRNTEIRILPASDDFLDRLSKSDVMVVGYSSTTIIESVLMGIPAIAIHYPDCDYRYKLAENQLCIGTWNIEELSNAIARIYDYFTRGVAYSYVLENRDNLEFFIGKNDGKNTQRTVDYIVRGC